MNPAISSIIGRVKLMERFGVSVHQASGQDQTWDLLICSEGISRLRVNPLGHVVRVTFTVPAGKQVQQVWAYWGAVLGQLRPALAALHRMGKPGGRPNPARAVEWAEA